MEDNHWVGGTVVQVWDQRVCSLVILSLSHVVANTIATGDLHGL
jgi:hypothetical protein